jgi:protein-S-isoprenylcysteine O-methyltransferase Ste14
MFGLPRFYYGAANWIVGIIFLLAGAILGVWSNYVQFTIGRGTPIPLMATQELLIQKPYSYCRNPMALGTIIAYSGVAVILGSIPAFALVFLGSAILLTYIKFLEEKEMVARFGKPYEMYRKTTPFIFPRLPRRD